MSTKINSNLAQDVLHVPKKIKLADLYFGHPGKFIQSLNGPFNPPQSKVPIQLGQLSCGCWIILDGNSRVGLILRKNPDATIGDYRKEMFCFYKAGEWDEEIIQWWNPYPKTMKEIMQLTKELNKLIRNKSSFSDTKIYQKLFNEISSKINLEKHICIS